MPEHRRQFSPQFKAEAVQMVIETGKPIAEVARIPDTRPLGVRPRGARTRVVTEPRPLLVVGAKWERRCTGKCLHPR
jgi:hypothetical protein